MMAGAMTAIFSRFWWGCVVRTCPRRMSDELTDDVVELRRLVDGLEVEWTYGGPPPSPTSPSCANTTTLSNPEGKPAVESKERKARQ